MLNENGKSLWILRGLLWGIFMFLVIAIASPVAEGLPLEFEKVIVKLILWLVMGLAYGYTVHLIEKRKS